MIFILILLLSIAVLLEGTIISLPLVLVCLLCFLIALRSQSIFYLAFIAGLALDIFKLQPLGSTAIYFIIFLYIIVLYQNKYEIDSYPFVIFSSFLGSYLFGFIFGGSNHVLNAGISSIFAVVLFAMLNLKFKVQSSKL